MLLQRDWDEVAVVALCGELACWRAAHPQERAEGPLQLHKAAELMATVMAWLHLESREFDCRSAAWPLALPQTTRNYCDEGSNCKHTYMVGAQCVYSLKPKQLVDRQKNNLQLF